MFLILVSTKLYLLCIVEINQFTAEQTEGSSYEAHILAHAVSLPLHS